MTQKVMTELDAERGVVVYPENFNQFLGNWRDEYRAEAAEVIKGLMEIAETAMSDARFATDSRVNAAREFLNR